MAMKEGWWPAFPTQIWARLRCSWKSKVSSNFQWSKGGLVVGMMGGVKFSGFFKLTNSYMTIVFLLDYSKKNYFAWTRKECTVPTTHLYPLTVWQTTFKSTTDLYQNSYSQSIGFLGFDPQAQCSYRILASCLGCTYHTAQRFFWIKQYWACGHSLNR